MEPGIILTEFRVERRNRKFVPLLFISLFSSIVLQGHITRQIGFLSPLVK